MGAVEAAVERGRNAGQFSGQCGGDELVAVQDLLWPRYAEPADLTAIEAVPLADRGLPDTTYALLDRAATLWPERLAASVLPDAARWALHLVVNAEGTALVEADQERLVQILTNLLNNALRHTPSGGQVGVTVEQSRDAIHLVVQDTGESITAEHLSHVFERFYRAHPARGDTGGSGIGLTISRAIVGGHHGRITVYSAGAGHGTEVRITLPRAG